MPVEVKLLGEDGHLVEEKIVPLCYPHQVRGVTDAVRGMVVTYLTDDYKKRPDTEASYKVLSREEVANLLRMEGRGAETFLANTDHDPKETRYVVSESDLDVRKLDSSLGEEVITYLFSTRPIL